jgi:hypothetical protein
MNTLWHDVRFGARMLAKKPGFTMVAVFTLALGIGAVTAIFSVVYAVLLRLLPYPESYHLVRAWQVDSRRAESDLSDPNFEESAAVILMGIVAGVCGIGALTNVLRGLLYGVTPADPLTSAGVGAVLLLVALSACYFPARRAMHVDPLVALRHE